MSDISQLQVEDVKEDVIKEDQQQQQQQQQEEKLHLTFPSSRVPPQPKGSLGTDTIHEEEEEEGEEHRRPVRSIRSSIPVFGGTFSVFNQIPSARELGYEHLTITSLSSFRLCCSSVNNPCFKFFKWLLIWLQWFLLSPPLQIPLPIEDLDCENDYQLDNLEHRILVENSVFTIVTLLANCGCTTYRVESVGKALSAAVGLDDVHVLCLPTMLTISFDPASAKKATRTLASPVNSAFSCSKMEALEYAIFLVIQGRVPRTCIFALANNALTLTSPFGSYWWQLGATIICNGACAAGFFGADWIGVALATGVGLFFIGPLMIFAEHRPAFRILFAPAVAFASAFVCRVAVLFRALNPNCYSGTSLSCIITLAPGISLALAALELASGSLVSGATRLIAALAVSFLLGIGLGFGDEIANTIPNQFNSTAVYPPCEAIPSLWLLLSFPLIVVTFLILLDGALVRWPMMIISGCVSFWVAYGLAFTALSSSIQTTITSACVGLFGVIFSHFTPLPPTSVVYSGVIFLVPGALSITTLKGVIASDKGADFGLRFLTIAVSVAVGILIATVPRTGTGGYNKQFKPFAGSYHII